MNVLFVLEYYPPYIGGVEVLFEGIAERLVDLDHEVHVVTSQLDNTDSFEVRNGVNVHRTLNFDLIDRYSFPISGMPQALRLAREADIIHTSTWTGVIPALAAKRITNTPAVVTIHEMVSDTWKSSGMNSSKVAMCRLIENLMMKFEFDHYVTVSETTRRDLISKGVGKEDSSVIYNGINRELFSPEKVKNGLMRKQLQLEDEFVYTYFGRPGFLKGVEYLIDAVPIIDDAIENAKLLLILAEEPKERYQKIRSQIREKGLEDVVKLIDPLPREILPSYVGASDCIVIPSLSEGFGFTTAESCALGVPVVATTAGSIPEVISGKHRLVEPENPESLARGVIGVYNGEYEELPLKHFSWEETVQSYIDAYEQILSKPILSAPTP